MARQIVALAGSTQKSLHFWGSVCVGGSAPPRNQGWKQRGVGGHPPRVSAPGGDTAGAPIQAGQEPLTGVPHPWVAAG